MGAGRSGTTLLTTILGNSDKVMALGEMHQFLDYFLDHKPCSCGALLQKCPVWGVIYADLKQNYSTEQLELLRRLSNKVESHVHVLKSLFVANTQYGDFQRTLFESIEKHYPHHTFIDSSKYVSRGLQLNKVFKRDFKIVFMTRDVRGVINSFKKNVQTSKTPLSTIIYYNLINGFALLSSWFLGKKKVYRFKYEDLVIKPDQILPELSQFLNGSLADVQEDLKQNKAFTMPHIIAGNRMRSEQQIVLKPDMHWKETQSRIKQILYYLATLPLQIIFKYRM